MVDTLTYVYPGTPGDKYSKMLLKTTTSIADSKTITKYIPILKAQDMENELGIYFKELANDSQFRTHTIFILYNGPKVISEFIERRIQAVIPHAIIRIQTY